MIDLMAMHSVLLSWYDVIHDNVESEMSFVECQDKWTASYRASCSLADDFLFNSLQAIQFL